MIKVSARIIKVKKYFCLSISTNYVMDFCDPKEILFYLVLGFSISETWKLLWKRGTFSIIKTKILILISSKGSYCNTHVGHCFQCLPIQNRDGQLQFSSFSFFFFYVIVRVKKGYTLGPLSVLFVISLKIMDSIERKFQRILHKKNEIDDFFGSNFVMRVKLQICISTIWKKKKHYNTKIYIIQW